MTLPKNGKPVHIYNELHLAFKLKVISDGTDMRTVVNELIRRYLDGDIKLLKDMKPKKQKGKINE